MSAERQLATTPAVRTPDATRSFGVLQRKCACGGSAAKEECEECKQKAMSVQRRANGGAAGPPAVPPIVHDVLRSPGQPLDASTRAYMEPRFGHDFSKVRVHADAQASESAKAVDALAYTVGSDMAFRAGEYEPASPTGRWLVAHELTHVLQQSLGGPAVDRNPSGRHEAEADAVASEVVEKGPASPAQAGSAVGLARADGNKTGVANWAGGRDFDLNPHMFDEPKAHLASARVGLSRNVYRDPVNSLRLGEELVSTAQTTLVRYATGYTLPD